MQQYNNVFFEVAISVSVCFIANISVIGVLVNLLGAPLKTSVTYSLDLSKFSFKKLLNTNMCFSFLNTT